MNAIPAELISVRIKEACRITGIGRSKLYQLIAAGEIRTVKVGSMTLIPVSGLRAFIEQPDQRGSRQKAEAEGRFSSISGGQ